jgi:hypothetical protein
MPAKTGLPDRAQMIPEAVKFRFLAPAQNGPAGHFEREPVFFQAPDSSRPDYRTLVLTAP